LAIKNNIAVRIREVWEYFWKTKVSSETNQDPCGVAEVTMNLTKPPNKNRQPSVLF